MSCTYCIIPLARGKEHSRPLAEVVDEVKALGNAGYQEIILTGVQISSYRDRVLASEAKQSLTTAEIARLATTHSLRDVVTAILKETQVPRLRLTSIALWDLDEALLDLWQDPRLCRHLHLSLQSGSDTVLRRMRRPYSTERFARAVELARAKIPGVGITTDVIVGFPGESDVEFEQSLNFVRAMDFSRVHVFPYSARAGTVAATLPLPVADAVKDARMKQMQAVADASARAFAQKFVGQTLQVLWETREQTADHRPQTTEVAQQSARTKSVCSGGRWSGYSDNYIRVVVESNADLHNRLTTAHITNVIDDGVLATWVDL